MLTSNQVTSRGCARGFILCVLWRGWQYVRQLKAAGDSICFPFADEVVQEWIDSAISDCCISGEFVKQFGGTEFSLDEPGSFWSHPAHFFTWWKNNVERKSKFLSLSKDAVSNDLSYDTLRSMYCRQAVALAVNIRNHFDRIVHQQRDATIPQIGLPLEMPSHMKVNDCVPINMKKIGDEVVVSALSYKYQMLESFVVSKFPMLKRFLKRRRPRVLTTDVRTDIDATVHQQHGDEIERSITTGSSDTHGVSKRLVKSSPSRSSSDSIDGTARGRVYSNDIGQEDEEDEEELARIEGGRCLRPRRCKRPRTYTFALSSAAFSDDSTQDTSRLLDDDSDDDDEEVEEGADDPDDQSDFCDSRRPKNARRCKRYRTRHSVRRHIAALRVQEVLCRYEEEEAAAVATATAAESGVTTPKSTKGGSPRKRYLRVPKSPAKKRLPKLHPSDVAPSFVKREVESPKTADHHHVASGPPKMQSPLVKNFRDMSMEDFVLFDEQEMLADPMLLSTSTSVAGTVSTASLCKDAAKEVPAATDGATSPLPTATDMLKLHPVPWQLVKSLPSDDVIAYARAKTPTHPLPATPDPVTLQVTVVAQFNCETPISTRGTPSESLSLISTGTPSGTCSIHERGRELLASMNHKDTSFLPISPGGPLSPL